jgi:hypothetical protein
MVATRREQTAMTDFILDVGEREMFDWYWIRYAILMMFVLKLMVEEAS